MIGHPQRDAVVPPGDPLRQAAAMRHQPGIRPRPGSGQAVKPALGHIVQQEVELLDAVGDQDQALLHRPLLERQQAQHRLFVPWVATHAPDRFGRVGDHSAGANHPRHLLHTPIADHADLCLTEKPAVYPRHLPSSRGLGGRFATACNSEPLSLAPPHPADAG